MEEQKKLIHKFDWDYLIILDACRYDYLAALVSSEVKIEKVLSPAPTTESWLLQVFPKRYDITVYAGTPFFAVCRVKVLQYQAYEHFKEIYPLWKTNWSEAFNTVLPRDVYNAARTAKPKSIIWFLQPHFPYLKEIVSLDKEKTFNWEKWRASYQ